MRTAIAVVLGLYAAQEGSKELLVAPLAVYWLGDMLDGALKTVATLEE